MDPDASIGLVRAAGWASWVAIVPLVASAIALALFFGGAGQFWGPVNDVLISVTLLLLMLPVLAVLVLVGDQAGTWFSVLTWLTLAGLLLAAAGQLLLVVGVITLENSYMTGGIGILPFLVWALATIWTGWAFGVPGMMVGVLVAAAIVLSGASAVVSLSAPGLVTGIVTGALVAVLCAWMAALGADLLGRA